MSGCGAPQQAATLEVDTDQVVLTGKVLSGGEPVGGAFVRLLDSSDEFTAEVVSSDEGDFRFYAAPGSWTVRALHRSGSGQAEFAPSGVGVHRADITLG